MRLAGSRGRNASLVSSRPPLRPFGSHSSGATTRRPTPGASYDPPRELERPTGRRGEASLSPGADDHYRTQLYLPLYLPDLLETAIMRRLNSARCCAQIRHGESLRVRGCIRPTSFHPDGSFRRFREVECESTTLLNLRESGDHFVRSGRKVQASDDACRCIRDDVRNS